MTLDLYVTFNREDTKRPKRGDIMQYAGLSFAGARVPEPEQRKLVNRFQALTSCQRVVYYPKTHKVHITAVGHGEPDETKFVEQVTACAREHYNVKRIAGV